MPLTDTICCKTIIKDLIRQRDDYTCQLCGHRYNNGKLISIHHIHHDGNKCFTDLIALCESCHRKCNRDEIPKEQCLAVLKVRGLSNYKNELKDIIFNLTIISSGTTICQAWKEKSAKCVVCAYSI